MTPCMVLRTSAYNTIPRHKVVPVCKYAGRHDVISLTMEQSWKSECVQWSRRLHRLVECKTAVTPVRQQWSYCSLALSHRYMQSKSRNAGLLCMQRTFVMSRSFPINCSQTWTLIHNMFEECTIEISTISARGQWVNSYWRFCKLYPKSVV